MSSHGIVTGEPVLSTTTVFGFAAATAATTSSCSPGRAIDVRSSPSVSQSSSVPTMTMASSALGGDGGRPGDRVIDRDGAGADHQRAHELVGRTPGSPRCSS